MRWFKKVFPSGSQVITYDDKYSPCYYIFGLHSDNNDLIRHQISSDLVQWLNGSNKPEWLSSLFRNTDYSVILNNGIKIVAIGPFRDRNPPKEDWIQVNDAKAKTARKELIDRLMA